MEPDFWNSFQSLNWFHSVSCEQRGRRGLRMEQLATFWDTAQMPFLQARIGEILSRNVCLYSPKPDLGHFNCCLSFVSFYFHDHPIFGLVLFSFQWLTMLREKQTWNKATAQFIFNILLGQNNKLEKACGRSVWNYFQSLQQQWPQKASSFLSV